MDKDNKYQNDRPCMGKPVRAQTPSDLQQFGAGTFTPGQAPKGGFQAVWNYSDSSDFHKSPVVKPNRGRI